MNYSKNLKYPYSNYLQLVEVLKQLAPYFRVGDMQPSQLHYLASQQTNPDQPHNKIYLTDTGIQRKHSMLEKYLNRLEKGLCKPIINVSFQLGLYPNNCNDSHIETAVKKAVKEVLLDGSIKHK